MTSWGERFSAFGLFHAVTGGVCVVVMVVLCGLGWWWKKSHGLRGCAARDRELGLRRVWAWSIVAWQVYALVWWLWPTHFNLNESLPLYVCDLAVWIAPVALLSKSRLARTILYFWGIALCTQGFITPVERVGFVYAKYWLFWVGHTQIVGSALYLVVVMGYRPEWGDYKRVALVGLGYAGCAFALNMALGTNYGYVGNTTPEVPTLVDRLGAWPVRVVWLVVLGLAAQFLALLPWVWGRKASGFGE